MDRPRLMHPAVRPILALTAALLVGASMIATRPAQAQSATVRGNVFGESPSGAYPVGYVPVTLSSPQGGRSQPYYSGDDGMYYISNVPFGTYTLEIWSGGLNNPPITQQITVASQPYVNVPPTRIR